MFVPQAHFSMLLKFCGTGKQSTGSRILPLPLLIHGAVRKRHCDVCALLTYLVCVLGFFMQ